MSVVYQLNSPKDGIHTPYVAVFGTLIKSICDYFKNQYQTVVPCPLSWPWTPPTNWTSGAHPVYYHDFENLSCVQLFNGATQAMER